MEGPAEFSVLGASKAAHCICAPVHPVMISLAMK
jgi:hypothetical protein